MRHIVAQADFTAQPLTDVKQWLAITGTRDDALLVDLLSAAATLCERFTGIFPLATTVVERHPASGAWTKLASRPVNRVDAVTALGSGVTRRVLTPDDYALEPAGDGAVLLRLVAPMPEQQVEVQLVAGQAQDWSALDPGLKQGIIRLAAYHYRERDNAAHDTPPAAVAALWRPFRRLRL